MNERDEAAGGPAPRHWLACGIGAGPANLSVAALFEAAAPGRYAVFERSPAPDWHDSTLRRGVRMQTSWVKDLVSLADPGNRHSFLRYLVDQRKLFFFLNSQFDSIPRLEYSRYLRWAAERIPGIHYGTAVDEAEFEDDRFLLRSGERTVATGDHLVLAVGSAPHTPEALAELPPGTRMAAEDLGTYVPAPEDLGAPVAVVGAGQTAAETVQALAETGHRDIRWIGRRSWFAPLEESPAGGEFFRPSYSAYVRSLPQERRRPLLRDQVLVSDGVTPATLRAIFQFNYESHLIDGNLPITMYPNHDVVDADFDGGKDVVLRCDTPAGGNRIPARRVLVACGRREAPLPLGPRLAKRITTDDDGRPVVGADNRIEWDGGAGHSIFGLNVARRDLGYADGNLSLLAVRSARVVNLLLGRTVFDFQEGIGTTVWA